MESSLPLHDGDDDDGEADGDDDDDDDGDDQALFRPLEYKTDFVQQGSADTLALKFNCTKFKLQDQIICRLSCFWIWVWVWVWCGQYGYLHFLGLVWFGLV